MQNASRSRRVRNLVHKLRPTDVTLLQLLHTIKASLQPLTTNLRRVHANLLLRKQLRAEVPELLAELEVLRFRRDLHAASEGEGFAHNGVGECALVLDIFAVGFGGQETADESAFGTDCLGADLGGRACCDTVEDFC